MPNRETPSKPLSPAEFDRLMAPFDVPSAAHVAVAVSGGADSLALALLLADWARARGAQTLGTQVTALTVDHALRTGSDVEALKVGAWLSALGINHSILTWKDGGALSSGVQAGIQARARDARYALMAGWCRTHGVKQLFVAHHLGDQAETFVMRLRRASTLFGLAAMAPMRQIHGINVCRPFLEVTKARLEATLRGRHQAWVEDPSNANPAFERVRTRALIQRLGVEGVTPARLAGAAGAAGRVTKILDRAAAAFETMAVTSHAGGGFHMEGGAFQALPQVVRERVLSQLLNRVGGQVYAPSPAKLERLARWMTSADGAGGTARTLGGCVVRRGDGGYSIVPEPPRKHVPQAKKARFFASAPLSRPAKRLTSQAHTGVHGGACDGAQAHPKC